MRDDAANGQNDTVDVEIERMTAEGAPAAPTPDATQALADEVAELRRERDDLYDRLLRKAAEFDNYRKRIDRERREMSELAAADLFQELLPIIDDFERALGADAGTAADPYRQGLELIHRQLLELLRKRGVIPIESLGAEFDPHYHQAVAQEANPQHRDGEIIAELRRGYRLGDRLLRPAMVKVAKA